MAEQKIVLEFTEQQIRDLDAMVTEGWRVLRDDVQYGSEAYTAALAIVHRIDANRRALLDGKPAPDAQPAGVVADFVAERAEYVTVLRQCTDSSPDYYRWQGHAEARRQLAERLGQPVAWPAEDAARRADRHAEIVEAEASEARCGK